MSNTDQVSVPLPAELREYVRQVAEVEERSQAAVIRSRSGGGLMATAAEQTFIAAVGRAEQTRQTAKASAFTTNAVAGAIPPANLAARMAKYWWVNHSQTFHQEIDGGYLWSPKTEASGARSQCCAILNRFGHLESVLGMNQLL